MSLPTGTSKGKEAIANYNQTLASRLRWPLIAFSILGAGYSSYVLLGNNWKWFSYHPSSMLIAFVALAGNASLQKRIGGYENTKLHGLLMILAVALAGFGWYVIHTNKNTMGRKHWTSLHAKIGVAVLLGYFSLAVVGSIALNPDWGLLRANKTVRLAHKLGGRFLTAAAWFSCVLGFSTMQQDVTYQLAFGAPLLVAGYFVLL